MAQNKHTLYIQVLMNFDIHDGTPVLKLNPMDNTTIVIGYLYPLSTCKDKSTFI